MRVRRRPLLPRLKEGRGGRFRLHGRIGIVRGIEELPKPIGNGLGLVKITHFDPPLEDLLESVRESRVQ